MLTLAACALVQEKPGWPDNIPPRSYYESRYGADRHNQQYQSQQDYLKWVQRFYAGWGGIDGWHSIREQILADVDAADQESMRRQLDELGRRISPEWAKLSDQRAIVNKTVQTWINAAYEAGARGDHERLLEEISADVDALLTDALEPAAITLSRYYPDMKPATAFSNPAPESTGK